MLGLVLATVMSVFNVFTDVSRKKILDRQHDAALVSFWSKVIAFFAYAAAIGVLTLWFGARPELPDIGSKFNIPPLPAFILYVTLNAFLEGTAILLNLRALQVSPISYCMPFMALTPLFLLPAGTLFLGESISTAMIIGVVLVVVGSMVVNRQLFAKGFFEPARAIFRERGSRYMVLVALLLTVTNIMDKKFVTAGGTDVTFAASVSRALTLSIGKCVMLTLFFVGLTIGRLGDWRGYRAKAMGLGKVVSNISWTGVLRAVPLWLVLVGILEAIVLVLQLTASQFTVMAVIISIKRSGIVLAVVLGYFIFKERGITDRVIASFVMLAGVLIFLNQASLGMVGAAIVAGGALLVMAVALIVTHKHVHAAAQAAAGAPAVAPATVPAEESKEASK